MLWLILMQSASADTLAGLRAARGDATRGETLYTARCGACHAIAAHGAGPRHCGLFGRRAGSQPGFDYSPALRAARIVWDARSVDRWLADPSALVPGNKMVVQLANRPQDRADLIAYLERATAACARPSDASST